MQGISTKYNIFKIGTEEKVELTATTGQWLKASRLVSKWKKESPFEDEPTFSLLWIYLAARSKGLEGTSEQEPTLAHLERFYDIWDVVFDEGENTEAPLSHSNE